ncbi:MAG: hypothetical protein MJZ20_10965 [Bacteroidaceae bacterium]|nr:hypothetical protein [Bacteroidaceae bacterium]
MEYIIMWVGINSHPRTRNGYSYTYNLTYNALCREVVWTVNMKGVSNGD